MSNFILQSTFWIYKTRVAVLRVGWFLLFLDLTIDKVQVTTHIHPGRTSPNPPDCPDPDCDPSVRESGWTQWTNRCEIPYFLLTERTYCTQNRQKSRTDISWQSWGQRFDPAYLHQKSPEISRFQDFFFTFLCKESTAFLQSCGLTQIWPKRALNCTPRSGQGKDP